MNRRIWVYIMASILLMIAHSPAFAKGRYALLIANQSYSATVGRLKNPINDINLIAVALRADGFEVTLLENVGRVAMLEGINIYIRRLRTAGDSVGLFYYSGHGASDGSGKNYLIPVDIKEVDTKSLFIQSVDVSQIVELMSRRAPNAVHFVVLDACRNVLNLENKSRGAGKGFVPVRAYRGMMIAYSSAPGECGSDAGKNSGPFAAALAKALLISNLDHLSVFHRVRLDVANKTGGDQVPWTNDGILSRVIFRKSIEVVSHDFQKETVGKRVALVIGNGKYKTLSKLPNPTRDANAIAALLKQHGFMVLKYLNLSRSEFLDAIEDFIEEVSDADTALVFYAGHGMELRGKNILAPVDANISCEKNKVRRTIRVEKLFDALKNVPRKIVIFDACRNDPLPSCNRAGGNSGAGFRGLVPGSVRGVLVANSTLSGQLAADGVPGKNSPFTMALLNHMKDQPSAYFRDLFDRVASDVNRLTSGSQLPEIILRGGSPKVCLSGKLCTRF